MRFSTTLIYSSLLSVTTLVFAQTTNSTSAGNITVGAVPSCVQNAFSSVLTTSPGGCTATNYTCLCTSQAFIAAVSATLMQDCPNVADQQAGIAYGQSVCATVGVNPAAANGTASTTTPAAGTSASPTPSPSTKPNGAIKASISIAAAVLALGTGLLIF